MPKRTCLVGWLFVVFLALCSILSLVGNSSSLPQLRKGFGAARPPCERVLVCVIAQTRGHTITWDKYQRNFLHNLCPGQPENVDLALAVAQESNTSGNGFYQHAKYVWSYPEVEDWGTAFDYAQQQSNCSGDWRSLLLIGDQWLGGVRHPQHKHPGSAGILVFFRWFLLRHLLESQLLDKYDRFIVTRSDYYYGVLHPPLSVLPRDFIWIPDGEGWSGVTDRHIVLPAQHVVAALGIGADLVCRPEQLFQAMAFKQTWNLEQVVKHQLERRGLWPLTRFFPYVMFTTRERDEASRWFAGAFSEEAGLVIKYQSEYDRYKQYRELIHNNSDWEAYMVEHQQDTLVNKN